MKRFLLLILAFSALVGCGSGKKNGQDRYADLRFRDSILRATGTVYYGKSPDAGSFDDVFYAFRADEKEMQEQSAKALKEFCGRLEQLSREDLDFFAYYYADLSDLATMADYAYQEGDVALPSGWCELQSVDEGNGLKCSLLKKGGRYVLAFSGTDFPADWKSPAQIAGFIADAYEDVDGALNSGSSQVSRAAAVVRDMVSERDIPWTALEFTGHSLGGRLAAEMSVLYGCPATTFNAAGVSPDVYESYESARQDADRSWRGFIVNVTAANDQLSCFQKYASGSSDPFMTALFGDKADFLSDDAADVILDLGMSAIGFALDRLTGATGSRDVVSSVVDKYYDRDYRALGATLVLSENMAGHGILGVIETLHARAGLCAE